MATVTFDTLKFVEKLKAAGVPEEQAKAEAEALQGVLADALDTQLTTRRDFDALRAEMRELRAEVNGKLTLLQWMLALVVAAEVVPILAKLFQ